MYLLIKWYSHEITVNNEKGKLLVYQDKLIIRTQTDRIIYYNDISLLSMDDSYESEFKMELSSSEVITVNILYSVSQNFENTYNYIKNAWENIDKNELNNNNVGFLNNSTNDKIIDNSFNNQDALNASDIVSNNIDSFVNRVNYMPLTLTANVTLNKDLFELIEYESFIKKEFKDKNNSIITIASQLTPYPKYLYINNEYYQLNLPILLSNQFLQRLTTCIF